LLGGFWPRPLKWGSLGATHRANVMQIISQCCEQRRRGVHCPPCLGSIPNYTPGAPAMVGHAFLPGSNLFSFSGCGLGPFPASTGRMGSRGETD